jgi:WD40 repeat-containing protein SMU1
LVLKALAEIDVPVRKLMDLYELIVVDLIKLQQVPAARSLLRRSEPTQAMRESQPDRYLALEGMLITGEGSSSLTRETVADGLLAEVHCTN